MYKALFIVILHIMLYILKILFQLKKQFKISYITTNWHESRTLIDKCKGTKLTKRLNHLKRRGKLPTTFKKGDKSEEFYSKK